MAMGTEGRVQDGQLHKEMVRVEDKVRTGDDDGPGGFENSRV